ncbi:hotdog family protein [Oxalobacteraceae bacterium R-40]|uniref:Hotdog family protein n=1 Tax=Keguizhuia sedimenti TaxID=3064264 RepID=A0ABU1BU40_9BURK|nr:hotdog family protein [Oxalobacteraceae bacterium R-40]
MDYGREWIARHIPHQGTMCLLDHVASFDEERLICIATSHAQADNPLRAQGRLGAATGIEYAAQAMAVHGALLAQGTEDRPKVGFLASVRSVELHVERLDNVPGALRIEAVRIHSEGNSILYGFTVHADQTSQLLLEGRAAVILNAQALTPGGK